MKLPRALTTLLLVAGCAVPGATSLGDPTWSPEAPASAPAEAQAPCADIPSALFAPKCGGAGCHASPGAAANLDLVSPGVEGRLVGKKDSRGAYLLIDPVDPEESLVYERVTGARPPQMPLGGDAIDEATTECLLAWIRTASAHAVPAADAAPGTGASVEGGAPAADADAAPSTALRIACGQSAPYTDHAGNVWAADAHFSGGAPDTHAPAVAIANTMDAPLYNSQRYGDSGGQAASFGYAFDVPNGSYQVTLKFAETYDTLPGQRVFDVSINGDTKLSGFDIVKTAGAANTATDQVFDVDVTGGTIKLQFDPGPADFPKVDAIEVLSK